MITFLRFGGVFLLLYMVFSKMFVFVNVSMTGWQFIAFIIVLTGIVEYIVERMKRGG